jgi:hypothetical protein
MDDKKRDDAADKAPRPVAGETPKPGAENRDQEAPNYDVAQDGGRAIPVDDMNSANDE